jgi:tetratricopeptide (TPR) repeat protein
MATRARRLEQYLREDPENLSLIADAASAALEEGDTDGGKRLLKRYAELSPPPHSPQIVHLHGLLALREKRYEDAASLFEQILAAQNDPAVRYNLAFAKAMQGDFAAADAALDEEAMLAASGGPALKVQALHQLERLDEALELGAQLLERRPDDARLAGALAVAALDAERVDLAATYAARAGEHPDGLSTLGALALDHGDPDGSMELFDRALRLRPKDGRALVGKGLSLLVTQDAHAVDYIDRGAEAFGTHLGSWIAAGWAYFSRGDMKTSRARFEHALSLDDTFAESHGSLAVIDLVDGDIESAKRRMQIALRLDPKCFSGALAQSLLLAAVGDAEKSARVRELALSTPIGPDGRTLAQAIALFGTRLAGAATRH